MDSNQPPGKIDINKFSPKLNSHNGKDGFLQDLVTYVNNIEGASVDITLQMSGLLVSGIVIAGDKYFTRIAELFYGQLGDSEEDIELKKDFKIMESGGDIFRQQRESPNKNFPSPSYIHLEECTIISNNQVSSYTVLWRGLISKVDGFFLGRFPVTKSKSKPRIDD